MKDQLRLLARAVKYRYKLDPAEISFLLGAVRPGMTALDLGAHKGAYAYWLARAVGSRGRVVCVEAQEGLARRLERVMRPRKQVSVVWTAISDHTGSGTLSLRPDGSSHGASIAGFADGEVGTTAQVPTTTLADLMSGQRLSTLDFIKCDVEGHEGAVFAASMDVIRQHRPTILLECEDRHAQGEHGGVTGMVRLFEPEGYRIRFFMGGTLHPLDAFDASRHQNYGVGEYCNNFVLDVPG
ncbi:MAG: FkbM family methyltransferase [Phycisphaerales bacterium]